MGLAFADYDNDGFTDIFVSNDTFENYLLHNNGMEPSPMSRCSPGLRTTHSAMPSPAWERISGIIDNDGRPDIFETAMFGEGFPLYKNLGDGQFQDVTARAGLSALTSRSTAWGAGDFRFRQRREQGFVHRQLRHSGQFDGTGAPAFCASESSVSEQRQLNLRGCEFKGGSVVSRFRLRIAARRLAISTTTARSMSS